MAILLGAFNGAQYIAEQLDSIISQTHKNWVLHISDDGSVDETIDIVRSYIALLPAGKIFFHTGPGNGFAQNFLSLVRAEGVVADYYAFCDQDDIWLPDKIERALTFVTPEGELYPVLYCSRTRLVDACGNPTGYSSLFVRKPSFNNALVQSLAGANTMLFNNAARELLRCVPPTATIVSHDWLVYMLTSGCGGKVLYDAVPRIYYRQHEGNLVGANNGFSEKIKRLSRVIGGGVHRWNTSNLINLSCVEDRLTDSSRQVFSDFIAAREARGFKRMVLLKRSGVYRQSRLDDLALCLAALIGKI